MATPPLPTSPPGTRLWAAVGSLALVSVVWILITNPSETGAALIGFWLGGVLFCLFLGFLVAGVFALIPALKRRFAGRLTTVAFWASAVFMILATLGQDA